jgi:transcriptional regulator with XRE-family HTH domain
MVSLMARTALARPHGERVQELREANGWSRQDLARRIRPRRTRQAIWLVETGKPVSVTLMSQVAKALKVRLDEITLPDEVAALANELGPPGSATGQRDYRCTNCNGLVKGLPE